LALFEYDGNAEKQKLKEAAEAKKEELDAATEENKAKADED